MNNRIHDKDRVLEISLFKKLCWTLNFVKINFNSLHYVQSVYIRSFYFPYFPACEMNTEIYSANHRIQFECRKIRTRKTPNANTFDAVLYIEILYRFSSNFARSPFCGRICLLLGLQSVDTCCDFCKQHQGFLHVFR